MAKPTSPETRLADFLAALDQPFCVVDSNGRIVFVSKPLAAWAGTTVDDLLGLGCRYHSEAAVSPAETAAAALCPPPQAFTGEGVESTIHLPGTEGSVRSAIARFVPLAMRDDATFSVLVVLDTRPVSTADAATEDTPPLHELLQMLRARQFPAARFLRFLGTNPAIVRARERLELAVRSSANVLIVAPPGGEANLSARELHRLARGAHALAVLDSPLADAELVQELFAASPAAAEHSGTREATLLCLEADRLSALAQGELQKRLLSRSRPMRVISTAQRSLDVLAAEQQFRPDLACLLSTIVVEMPPLADRAGDLPLIAQALVEEQNAAGEKQLSGFTPDALNRLVHYGWPGDVQELGNVIRQAHDRAAGPFIAVGDLPTSLLGSAPGSAPRAGQPRRIDLESFLGTIETELLRRALAWAKGNKTKAARFLGMTRPRLYRRLVQRGLEEPAASQHVDEIDWLDETPEQ